MVLPSSKSLLAYGLWPAARLAGSLGDSWRRLWAFARLRSQLPGVDPSVVILGTPELHGTRAIQMGRELYLYRGLYFETRDSGRIRLGDRVVMSRGVHLVAYAGIDIGAGTMIGEYTSIRDAGHRFGGGRAVRDSGHAAAPIQIGRNVWIGRGVTILPGVCIGDDAVVGANAVVTHDIPAAETYAGIPARRLTRAAA